MIDNFLAHLQNGIYHIFNANAYDHILFLIVLSVPYLFKDWKRILFLVSVFTLAHCLSLMLVVYKIISISQTLIDFLIPVIIFIVGLFNVFTAGKKSHTNTFGLLFFATLFFGLVHGLGFTDDLNRLVATSESKWIAILEIGLGIEIGQLILCFVVLFISFLSQTLFRFSKRDWVMVSSSIVVGIVLPMLIRSELWS
ncbi:HupE/UreJ family protein [Psychroserpens sp. XS_ASV72]|uniref:HupE/UreJ family protein n=1 Tax=Psychroserpens sp. XS_ASV72 TaxID=3241293 RepID=UPI003513A805